MIAAWSLVLAVAASATGFDHVIHEGRVIGSVAEPPACTACHTVRGSGALAGVPDHAACFGACHGETPARPRRRKPYTIAAKQRRVCTSCHAAAELDRLARGELTRPAVQFPPYTLDPDYTLVMPHAKHAGTPCRDCHRAPGFGESKRAPHDRCAGCHARPAASAVPTMTECATCHRPAFGPAVGPTLARGTLPVGNAFDHRTHAAKQAADDAADCSTCHAAIAATDSEVLPAPTMEICATCHDGTRAFSTTTTRCRTCHQRAPSARPESRTRVPFSHARHARLDGAPECAACHPLDASGRPRAPGGDHLPCADGPCHAADFAALQPTICSTCHIGNEPWRALRWFPLPRRASEFGMEFSHTTHDAARERCTDCHAVDGARIAVTGGHRSCAGADCHRLDGPPAPLTACASCHTRGPAARSDAAAAASEWSVRATFRHDLHDSPCADCHLSTDADDQPGALSPIAKAHCASCHDGARAFKMTGHACSRCHAK